MPKKSLTGLRLAISVTVIALAGVLIYFLVPVLGLTNRVVPADELLRQYFAAIDNGHYEDLYGMLSAESQEAIS